MDPSGTLLAGAWNDWHFNDGCGFSHSTDGGDTWAPESFVPGLTRFTNDPSVPGLNPTFAIAGDPAVAYNPKFGDFVVMCQAFGSATGNQIQLLSTAFDPAKVTDRNDTNGSYGLAAWHLPASAVATGASNGSQKGSNGKFPDHETITVDTNPSSPFYGRVYVGWAEFSGFGRSPIDVAFSDDDGAIWTGPIRVSDNGHQFDQDARPSIAPNGDVYMTWINGPNEGSLKNTSRWRTSRMTAARPGEAMWSSLRFPAHMRADCRTRSTASSPTSGRRRMRTGASSLRSPTGEPALRRCTRRTRCSLTRSPASLRLRA
jgi:hypothetical protein